MLITNKNPASETGVMFFACDVAKPRVHHLREI